MSGSIRVIGRVCAEVNSRASYNEVLHMHHPRQSANILELTFLQIRELGDPSSTEIELIKEGKFRGKGN